MEIKSKTGLSYVSLKHWLYGIAAGGFVFIYLVGCSGNMNFSSFSTTPTEPVSQEKTLTPLQSTTLAVPLEYSGILPTQEDEFVFVAIKEPEFVRPIAVPTFRPLTQFPSYTNPQYIPIPRYPQFPVPLFPPGYRPPSSIPAFPSIPNLPNLQPLPDFKPIPIPPMPRIQPMPQLPRIQPMIIPPPMPQLPSFP